jgi:hypothetical protein
MDYNEIRFSHPSPSTFLNETLLTLKYFLLPFTTLQLCYVTRRIQGTKLSKTIAADIRAQATWMYGE